jgi:uncharacterized protein YigE (DUF2233 family)
MIWLLIGTALTDPVIVEDVSRYHERWRVVRIDPTDTTIHLVGREPIQRSSVGAWNWAKTKGWNPLVVMNGGMFHPNQEPVGLFIDEEGVWKKQNREAGKGNFFLEPNGIFGVDEEGHAFVVASSQYKQRKDKIATQSGPMLVVSGDIHPRFQKDSPNERIRNGVGVTDEGTIIFVMSQTPVRFYDFAQLMHIDLKCSNALYLDGVVSVLKLNEETIGGKGGMLGPMLVVGTNRD